jgi:hypothetical protein
MPERAAMFWDTAVISDGAVKEIGYCGAVMFDLYAAPLLNCHANSSPQLIIEID